MPLSSTGFILSVGLPNQWIYGIKLVQICTSLNSDLNLRRTLPASRRLRWLLRFPRACTMIQSMQQKTVNTITNQRSLRRNIILSRNRNLSLYNLPQSKFIPQLQPYHKKALSQCYKYRSMSRQRRASKHMTLCLFQEYTQAHFRVRATSTKAWVSGSRNRGRLIQLKGGWRAHPVVPDCSIVLYGRHLIRLTGGSKRVFLLFAHLSTFCFHNREGGARDFNELEYLILPK